MRSIHSVPYLQLLWIFHSSPSPVNTRIRLVTWKQILEGNKQNHMWALTQGQSGCTDGRELMGYVTEDNSELTSLISFFFFIILVKRSVSELHKGQKGEEWMIIHALIVVMKGTTIYNAIRHDEKFTSSMPFSFKKTKRKGQTQHIL